MDIWLLVILFPLVTSLLVTLFILPKIIDFSEQGRLFAKPGDRTSHEGDIPIFGGVGIFIGILVSLLLWIGILWEEIMIDYVEDSRTIFSILISLTIVFFTGFIDDLLSLSPVKKLFAQILSILSIIFLGDLLIDNMQGVFGVDEIPKWVGILFTIFVVVVVTNSYNLIDGIDGLAAGLGVISSLMFGLLFYFSNDVLYSILSFCLSGSLIGFIKFNFHPARIFMGDTGSLVVGLILSILSIRLVNQGVTIPFEYVTYSMKGPLIAIVLLSIPLFDTFRVFFIRALSGYNPLMPDRNHIHHALLDLGLGHKLSSIILYITNVIVIFISYYMIDIRSQSFSIFILAVIVLASMSIPFILLRLRNKQ